MKRNEIITDVTVLEAALDPRHNGHRVVRDRLSRLLDDVVEGRALLVTHTDAVTAATSNLTRRDVADATSLVARLARAYEVVPLHADLLRDARLVVETAALHGVALQLDTALTIELARRRGTRRVMSLDPMLRLFDLERVLDGQSSPT